MDKNDLLDELGDLLWGALFVYALWYLLIGVLYALAFIYAVFYAALVTFILPPLSRISGAAWRFLVFRLDKRHTQLP